MDSIEPLRFNCVPDSAIVRGDSPWFVPDGATEPVATLWAGVLIVRLGKSIRQRFACRYYSDFVFAVHPQGGRPQTEWVNDGAMLLGTGRIAARDIAAGDAAIPASLTLRDGEGQAVLVAHMPAADSFDAAIAAVTPDVTVKTGDIILLPLTIDPGSTPAAFNPLSSRHFRLYAGNDNSQCLLHFKAR